MKIAFSENVSSISGHKTGEVDSSINSDPCSFETQIVQDLLSSAPIQNQPDTHTPPRPIELNKEVVMPTTRLVMNDVQNPETIVKKSNS